jgi:hypothetical protein
VPAQHRLLVAQNQQLSILGPAAAEHQDGQAEYPARQQVDDLEQHPPSQPSPRPSLLATVQVNHPIEYSSVTG